VSYEQDHDSLLVIMDVGDPYFVVLAESEGNRVFGVDASHG